MLAGSLADQTMLVARRDEQIAEWLRELVGPGNGAVAVAMRVVAQKLDNL
jgi:Mn-containing catalase